MKWLDFINIVLKNVSTKIIKYISENLEIWEGQERNAKFS
jgi:hypothetical protein